MQYPKKFLDDATHIAYATFYKTDLLVSWNFKHIVNIDRIRKYNSVNMMQGYSCIEIRTPREVIYKKNENFDCVEFQRAVRLKNYEECNGDYSLMIEKQIKD
jgi:hypothetical protein